MGEKLSVPKIILPHLVLLQQIPVKIGNMTVLLLLYNIKDAVGPEGTCLPWKSICFQHKIKTLINVWSKLLDWYSTRKNRIVLP
ncbi:hypothetical protein GDO81_029850 [Engystomops pustulosus]|uniref:Uncharacterized protein n=1 Tax=Engystomops pustulosus TaxID=76066 RepID=A0AAV6YI98_ENGPU|nr:hypothetical protein GDO81_029850 [Engystomops pustulosus]